MAPRSIERSCYVYRDIWSSKNKLLPEQVAISNGKKFWFDCYTCGHGYEQTPANKTQGDECPYCTNKKLCGNLECTFCLSKSCYIYHEIWSSNNETRPEQVSISNDKKVWFKCNDCPHEYNQTPGNKTHGYGCPYCANKKLCGNLGCTFCLPKSCYVYREIWSTKNEILPEQVSISSDTKFFLIVKFVFMIMNKDHQVKQKE
jgi:DNA-directed RNA polymerase subunit RPC12/RpoP